MTRRAARARGGRAPHFVQSLERGLAVIRAFGAAHAGADAVATSRARPGSRARRRGASCSRSPTSATCAPTAAASRSRPRVLELGYAFLSSLSLPEVAEPHLERLVAEVHESSSVQRARRRRHRLRRARADLADHARLDQRRHALPRLRDLDGPRAARRAARRRARRLPRARRAAAAVAAHDHLRARRCAPSSRRVRAQGWALVDQELEEGLRSIAAPIRDRGGASSRRSTCPRTRAACRSRPCGATLLPPLLRDGGADRGRPARGLATRRGGRRMTRRRRAPPPRPAPRPAPPGERAGAAIVLAIVLLAINLRTRAREPAAADRRRPRRPRALGRRGRAADDAAGAVLGRASRRSRRGSPRASRSSARSSPARC